MKKTLAALALAASMIGAVVGCSPSSEKATSTEPAGTQVHLTDAPTSLIQIPADFTPLFDENAKLEKGAVIQCTGRVEAGEGMDSARTPTAMLRVGNGLFEILLDTNGKQLRDSMDMKVVEIMGHLTGKSSVTISSMQMTSTFSGTAGSTVRIPEVKVDKFQPATPDPELAKSLEAESEGELQHYIKQEGGFVYMGQGLADEVKHILKGNPSLISFKDKDGSTPLFWAVWQNRSDIEGGSHKALIKWLVENGADVNAKNNAGQSPFSIATGDLAELLRKHGGHG